MKRIILTVISVFCLTMTFAENKCERHTNRPETYDMSLNYRRLGECLGLTLEQMENVANVHENFCEELLEASKFKNGHREKLVREAVDKELKYLSYILDEKQMDGYRTLLNNTLNNKGITRYRG